MSSGRATGGPRWMTSQLAKYWSTEYEPTNSTLDVISRGRVVYEALSEEKEILCSLKYVEDEDAV